MPDGLSQFAPPNPFLSIAVLLGVVIFPCIHLFWRKRKHAPPGAPTGFERIDAIKMAWAGASAPQAVCMIIWPVWPSALRAITEAPLLLIPTGIAAMTLLIGDVFDWK